MPLQKCMGEREGLTLAVGGGKVRGGSSRVWGGGVTRAELPKELDGGDSLLIVATTDSSSSRIRQQCRTTFCALKHTRSSYRPAIYLDSGLPFDASSEVHGGGAWPWRLEAGPGGHVVVGCWTHCFALSLFVVWVFGYFSIFLIVDTRAAYCRMANDSNDNNNKTHNIHTEV